MISKDGFDLVRCENCDLVFVSNPPSESELSEMYSFDSGYHAKLEVDAFTTKFHKREADRNLDLLLRHAKAGRLLDIGCSTGMFLVAAKKAGWVGVGLEYSPDSSRVARDVHGLDVRTGALAMDTYAPNSFDVITLWDVIEHIPNPKQAMELISRILAPGGLLMLKTPNVDGIYPTTSFRLARALNFWGHPEPPGHLFQFSVKTLQRLATESGFEAIAVHHQRIPITYSFGTVRSWFRSIKWAAYCALFIPLAFIGPMVRSGDDIAIVFRKPEQN